MTIGEYISQKLNAFGNISEAQLLDMLYEYDLSPDMEYSPYAREVGLSMIRGVEEIIFLPKLKSVNESGFSLSWDYDGLGRYYLWLCRKWGVTPNDEALGMLGISMIIDRTDCW